MSQIKAKGGELYVKLHVHSLIASFLLNDITALSVSPSVRVDALMSFSFCKQLLAVQINFEVFGF